MKSKVLNVLFAVAVVAGVDRLNAQTWPPYENTTRTMGTIYDLQSSAIDGVPFVTFTLRSPDGNLTRYECPNAPSLACDQVTWTGTYLVSGHQQGRFRPGCSYDGVENYSVPNVIWSCAAGPSGWACTQLVP